MALVWVVETGYGEFRTADRDEARDFNKAEIGSSMYAEEI